MDTQFIRFSELQPDMQLVSQDEQRELETITVVERADDGSTLVETAEGGCYHFYSFQGSGCCEIVAQPESDVPHAADCQCDECWDEETRIESMAQHWLEQAALHRDDPILY